VTNSQPSRIRQRWLYRSIQAVVSISLLTWLALTLDWNQLAHIWVGIDPIWVLISVALYYANLALSCAKWRITLAHENLSAPFIRLLRWYMIGSFANNFLPTDIGGDLGRGMYATRTLGHPTRVTRSIIVERLTGLLAMALLAWMSLGFLLGQWWLVALIAVGVLAGLAVLPWIDQLGQRAPSRLQRIYQLGREVVISYYKQPKLVLCILSISMVSQICNGIGVWLNMRAIHVDLPIVPVILSVGLTGLIGTLPISINGWGVRESLYIGLLTGQSASAPAILAGALFGRFLATLLTLVGAVSLIVEPHKHDDRSAA
jgi:uncharacterized membrane protein YbhN (UPF0104 family)